MRVVGVHYSKLWPSAIAFPNKVLLLPEEVQQVNEDVKTAILVESSEKGYNRPSPINTATCTVYGSVR